MNTIKITTTQNIELEYDLASLGERILAALVDVLILIAYAIVLLVLFWSLESNNVMSRYSWIGIIFYLPMYFYNLSSEIFMNGQSVGKRVMNIRVISIDGAKASVGQYLIRWIFRLVDFSFSFFLCGIICIAVSERKQRLGDMVAGTTVIKTEPRTTFQQTMYEPVQPKEYIVTYPQITTLKDEDIQLIKEVIIVSKNSGNYAIAEKAAAKIGETLNVTYPNGGFAFLNTLLSDYNYLSSKDDA